MSKRLRSEIVDIVLPTIQSEIRNSEYSSNKVLALLDNILSRYFNSEYFDGDIIENPDYN